MLFVFFIFIFMYLSSFIEASSQAILQSGAGFYLLAPTSISQPGTYKLAQDIVGTVTISTNNVMFDLNGHKITGATNGDAIDVSNQTGIIIQNGIINSSNNGISINSCQRVNIFNINFTGQSLNGLLLVTGTNINVNNCNFQAGSVSSQTVGLLVSNCWDSFIINSNFTGYSSSTTGTAILFGASGSFGNTTNSSACTLDTITVSSNASGIVLTDAQNITVSNSVLNNNTTALNINSGEHFIIGNTFANNTTGLSLSSSSNLVNNNAFQANTTSISYGSGTNAFSGNTLN